MRKLWHILTLWFLTAPALVWAQAGGSGSENGDSDAQPVLTNPISSGTVQEIADKLIDFFLVLAAPIAVIMTIYAGYLFLTAGDNQDKVKTARKTLLYVVVGVAVLILSKGIVSWAKSFIS